jgi:flagellar hook-length control protein FliK
LTINFRRNPAADFTHYLSERPEMSSQDEISWKAKPTRKKNKMSQRKAKKTIEVRDLMPLRDAKGGRHHRHRHTSALSQNADRDYVPRSGYGIHQPQ